MNVSERSTWHRNSAFWALRVAGMLGLLVNGLQGGSLILQSERQLQPQLENALAQEVSSTIGGDHLGSFVVRIHGICRIPLQPVEGDLRSPLGWVDRVDGQMLSVIHVDCTRIGQALRRLVVNPTSSTTCEMYARAIARVIRHEMHHLMMNTAQHEKHGENKASLRAEELVKPHLLQAAQKVD